MNSYDISIYPKQELLSMWKVDKQRFCPDAVTPPHCLRCGSPLHSRLAENALSRALDIHICAICGMDEGLRDASDMVIPVIHWYAVQKGLLPAKENNGPVLVPECSFSHVYDDPKKQLALSSIQHPVSLVTYSRSDYDGRRWWTNWFIDPRMRPDKALATEIDIFQNDLLELPEFQTLWHMERMCKLYAQRTEEPTEFNLYSETEHFYIWLRLICRARDYNLYVYYYSRNMDRRNG